MKFFYQEFSKKSAIYVIINTLTNRFYIGQTSRIKTRWYSYQKNLPKGIGHNKFLINDYNKCKEIQDNDDFFEFHIIKIMENSTKSQRLEVEEFWINEGIKTFGKESCYNFKLEPTKETERSCYSKTPEESKKKMSKTMKQLLSTEEGKLKHSNGTKKNWQNPVYKKIRSDQSREKWKNPEFREKITIFMKTRKLSEEHKQKIRESVLKSWIGNEERRKLSAEIMKRISKNKK